jgi:glycosyltransferase involved in cell wall biosynthesis
MNDGRVPVSVLIPTKNESANLGRCLGALHGWADEIVVVDSQSADGTQAIAEAYGARVIQFRYAGGWPKKRQHVLGNYEFRNPWILLLDADEVLTEDLRTEIAEKIGIGDYDGYWIRNQNVFLGRQLRFGDSQLWKLSLFRRGRGHFEKRLEAQDASMGDIEIHEHVVVHGKIGSLKYPLRHENFNTLDRYIQKHSEYSNWEAKVWLEGTTGEHRPNFFGSQVQRRRWLKMVFSRLPGASALMFAYLYLFRLGFLDGKPGFLYCWFRAMQVFHVKAKIYELKLMRERAAATTKAAHAAAAEDDNVRIGGSSL